MNVLLLIVYVVFTGAFCHSDRRHQVDSDNHKVWADFEKKYDRTRIDIDDVERLALKSVFRDIEIAYTNYQVEAMENAMANVSNRIDHVQGQLFMDLHWGIMSFFANYFIHGALRQQFDTVADFERFVTAHTKTALFLGDCYCRRNDYYDGYLKWIEAETFGVLKTYVDKFHEEGKSDFEEIAKKFMGMWITHIESNQGFIRRYAHCQYEHCLALIGGGRGWTRERAISVARGSAELLIRYGYTPKWLDEFK